MFKNKTVEEKKAFKNKVALGVAGVGITVGAFALGVTIGKYIDGASIIKKNIIKQGIAINSPATLIDNSITVLVKRGHAGNIIRCVETGETFASQNRAADLLNISKKKLSQHLKGNIESVDGLTFESLGEFPTQQ